MRLSLGGFCDVVYSWLTEGAETKALEKFDRELHMPPPGIKTAELAALPEWSPEAQAQAFMSTMSARSRK